MQTHRCFVASHRSMPFVGKAPLPTNARTGTMVQARSAAPAAKGKKKAATFVIDCTKPVEDKIMEIAAFEKFLQDHIKVDGKTGMPHACMCAAAPSSTSCRCAGRERHGCQGEDQDLRHVRNPNVQEVRWVADVVGPCSMRLRHRYLKYLTKKFLKKHNVRDWLRVIASNKDRKYVHYWVPQRSNTVSPPPSVYELRYFNIADNEADDEE